jgi:poly(3-hydroxybutyrate) depolymerase
VLYHAYEFTHAAMGPFRAAARINKEIISSPLNPASSWISSRTTAAAMDMFINATRRYGKPEFGIDHVEVAGKACGIREEIALERPFGNLLHFKKTSKHAKSLNHQKVLIVAPMSGHYATLLRGTVRAMLPEHDVYITDWTDVRDVAFTAGRFDLDDYADYLIEFCQHLGQDGHRSSMMAVCQPGIPAMVAASLMAERDDPARPSSVILMGSPIDTLKNPQKPNHLATTRSLDWFKQNAIATVPWPNPGFLRRVYPGFLQLSGFMSMNLDRHVDAHTRHFAHMVKGDGESAAAHREFYDEYMAVMDMSAEFYLQTIDRVFQRRLLAIGEYDYRDQRIDPSAITDIAFMTIEGARDDITGLKQTEAAHDLLTKLPKSRKAHFVVPKVGHYGVFNGSRWREITQPKVRDFMAKHR